LLWSAIIYATFVASAVVLALVDVLHGKPGTPEE
jgi:hypothetical protein